MIFLREIRDKSGERPVGIFIGSVSRRRHVRRVCVLGCLGELINAACRSSA